VALLLGGSAPEALAPLRAARAGHQSRPAPYDEAVTRLYIARALAATGDRGGAETETALALAALGDLGAAPPPGWPVRPGAPQTALPGGLSRREAEILTAIAEGLSNRDVAARRPW
jgi:DNA-binding NarL/FixJ family response regulator